MLNQSSGQHACAGSHARHDVGSNRYSSIGARYHSSDQLFPPRSSRRGERCGSRRLIRSTGDLSWQFSVFRVESRKRDMIGVDKDLENDNENRLNKLIPYFI